MGGREERDDYFSIFMKVFSSSDFYLKWLGENVSDQQLSISSLLPRVDPAQLVHAFNALFEGRFGDRRALRCFVFAYVAALLYDPLPLIDCLLCAHGGLI